MKATYLMQLLERGVEFASGLRSSNSARWPTRPSDTEIRRLGLRPGQYWDGPEALVTVVLDEGIARVLQRPWNPAKYYPQQHQTLVASIFNIDDVITVVVEDDYDYALYNARS